MPKKTSDIFLCTNCQAQFTKWTGRCLECGKWGTIEQAAAPTTPADATTVAYAALPTQTLADIKDTDVARVKTSISELDRVLGGGFVPGSLILLSGEPGIGKSTLALQLAIHVPNTLYISGEESVGQVKLRANRVLGKTASQTLRLANAAALEPIITTIKKDQPGFVVIDSIQTISSAEASGEPGSMTQIRAATAMLLETAKSTRTTIMIIGHVTKDGTVAGPKTLEHLVDTVLYFEGDPHRELRLLRAVKNRFGSTDEVGLFEMAETGLTEVKNPSSMLLAERGDEMPGSIVTCLMEGTRPILVEIQALVNKTVFGYPVRKASGFDINRLHVLTAVLQRRAGLNLAQYDIHLNVVGGLEANEPAADLAVCLAIASAYKDKALGKDLAVFGEVGLGGEVRGVRHIDKRLRECEHLGISRLITAKLAKKPTTKVKLIEVKNIEELIKHS